MGLDRRVGRRSLRLAKAKESPIACQAFEAMLIR